MFGISKAVTNKDATLYKALLYIFNSLSAICVFDMVPSIKSHSDFCHNFGFENTLQKTN